VSELLIGDPINPKTEFGAITSKDQYEKILAYIKLSKEQNGSILIGGKVRKLKQRCDRGWFIEPTVIEGLDWIVSYIRKNFLDLWLLFKHFHQ